MIFIKTIVTAILLSSFAASAAPPDPVLPTGACAGLLKKNTLNSFSPSDLASRAGMQIGTPNVSMYFDFDNGLFYLTGVVESGAAADRQSADDFTTTEIVKLADGNTFTVKVSETASYAIEVTGKIQEEETRFLFIPTNGGSTFFVHLLDSPEAGVCQKV
ncbi:hypothetical protein N8756_09730 [Pseudomonadales bacterium]|jgi:hypothetical protein|nr:hypothetical protein [Pseudomonadales bacterium]